MIFESPNAIIILAPTLLLVLINHTIKASYYELLFSVGKLNFNSYLTSSTFGLVSTNSGMDLT